MANPKVRKAGQARLQSWDLKWETAGSHSSVVSRVQMGWKEVPRVFTLKQQHDDGDEARRVWEAGKLGWKPC